MSGVPLRQFGAPAPGRATKESASLNAPFFFLRHGESENNKLDVVNGWTNCALTEKGRAQAHTAAQSLIGLDIPVVITSPLLRARETAEIVGEALGVDVEVVAGLKERNWGVLENGPRSALTDYFMVPDGGESWDQYRLRVWPALRDARFPPRSLLVGHAGTARVLRSVLSIPDTVERIPNAVPVCFRINGGYWEMEYGQE